MSNAFEVSRNILQDISLFSKELITYSTSVKITCVVFLFGIDPNWYL